MPRNLQLYHVASPQQTSLLWARLAGCPRFPQASNRDHHHVPTIVLLLHRVTSVQQNHHHAAGQAGTRPVLVTSSQSSSTSQKCPGDSNSLWSHNTVSFFKEPFPDPRELQCSSHLPVSDPARLMLPHWILNNFRSWIVSHYTAQMKWLFNNVCWIMHKRTN